MSAAAAAAVTRYPSVDNGATVMCIVVFDEIETRASHQSYYIEPRRRDKNNNTVVLRHPLLYGEDEKRIRFYDLFQFAVRARHIRVTQ